MDSKTYVVHFCHQSGKCPVLEISSDHIVLADSDQTEPGRVRLTRDQAEGLLAALENALAKTTE